MKKIWINGCFDILHRGHLELFRYAKSLDGEVIVGIDSDQRVKNLKGHTRPINNQEDRVFFLESIEYIDKVVIFNDEDELSSNIRDINPDVMIVGSDYKNKRVIGREHAKQLVFFDRIGDYSTTKILEKEMITDDVKLTYVFDIDGTLCSLTDGKYENAIPLEGRIDMVNDLYDQGHCIILNTARGMGRTKNNQVLANEMFRRITENQLSTWGVKYHQLFLGKPAGDIYIDDKGEKDENFFNPRN